MIEINLKDAQYISGASYITADYINTTSQANVSYETMRITFTNDGSLPREFQERINAGASWDEIAPYLIMYSMIYELHPEFFQ